MRFQRFYVLLLPGLLFLTLFMVVPIALTIGSTFFPEGRFSIDGYRQFLTDPTFFKALLTTLEISAGTTALCVLFGFPVAYFIAGLRSRLKGVLLALSVFPLLTSSVVRSFSWMIILGKKGLLNSSLLALGLIREPLEILYTPAAVLIGLVHLFLPLIIITLVGVMENIDPDVIKAAESLGASKWAVFRRVIVPLSVPGLLVGSVLVFVGSLTAYTTPALLGGKQRVISTLLYQQAMTLNDWHMASVIATVMIVITFVVVGLLNRLAGKIHPKG